MELGIRKEAGIIMAKLPALVTKEIDAIWPEDWALREKNSYSILGQAVRNRIIRERIKEKEVEEKSRTD